MPDGGHSGADQEKHGDSGEDVAEDEAKEEGFGIALIDFRGRVWGRDGAGPHGRCACDDEEESVDGHDDAHGGKLEEDTDGGGYAEWERTTIAGGFEEGDQRDDAYDREERSEKGIVGSVHEGVEEGDHAAEGPVCLGVIGVCEAIWMRGEARVAYGLYSELEASLDEGLVDDEAEGGKREEGEDEEGT